LLNGLAIWLLGMPDPLLFGTLAFLLNYFPILGPVTGVVIFFFVGVFSFPSTWQAFIPAAIYLGIHILEGETITPMLLARRFTLSPVKVTSSLNVLGLAVGHTRRAALDATVGSHQNRMRSYRGSDAAWPSARRQFGDAEIEIASRGTIQCADATTAMTTACR
jgi:AI-2E family transporter